MSKFGKQSLNSLMGVHPNLGRLMTESIKDTPVDFTITDGGRTAAAQRLLWLKGRNASGKVINKGAVVTNADGYDKKSNHQAKDDGYYHAVDLYPYVNGKIDFDDVHGNLPKIAAHIKAVGARLGIKIRWGGDFKSILDRPHFELL